MLQSGMDPFSFVASPPAPRSRLGWLASLFVGLLGAVAAPAMAQAVPGVVVVLRPVTDEAVPVATASPREQPQAAREAAQAVWQLRHGRQAERMQGIARESGLATKAVGSAGSAMRLDFEKPLSGLELDAALRRLRLQPDVLAVVPNERLQRSQTRTTPNDPMFAQQWHLQSPGAQASAINMPLAWGRATGATTPLVVAVVDSGVRFEHPDLAGRVLPGYDLISELEFSNDGNGRDADASDPGDWISLAESRSTLYQGCEVQNSSWHGTAIAGEIAAASNNSQGVAGLHWGASILPVRVSGKCGALLSDLLDGLRWAAGLPVSGVPVNTHPARIINLSFGGSGACDAAYQQTVNDVAAAGALLVVAAGNQGSTLTRPADCNGVVAVTAVRGDGAKAEYANYGGNVALAAPGGSALSGSADFGLLTTINSGKTSPQSSTYGSLAGTSFAAPLVSGVAALMWSVQPTLGLVELKIRLRAAVRAHTYQATLPSCSAQAVVQGACNCTTAACGGGVLDADKALSLAAMAPGSAVPTPDPAPPIDTSGGGGALGWAWGGALWLWLLGVAISRRLFAGQRAA